MARSWRTPFFLRFLLITTRLVRSSPNVRASCSSRPNSRPSQAQQILDEVVSSYLWLAEKLARQFCIAERTRRISSRSHTGLVEACLRFDPHQGSFVGFAEPTITGVLKRHFRDHGWTVRPPRPTQELASIIWRRWPTLVQEMGALPCAQDLAHELGAPVRRGAAGSLGE